jgi:hypothetical protein
MLMGWTLPQRKSQFSRERGRAQESSVSERNRNITLGTVTSQRDGHREFTFAVQGHLLVPTKSAGYSEAMSAICSD